MRLSLALLLSSLLVSACSSDESATPGAHSGGGGGTGGSSGSGGSSATGGSGGSSGAGGSSGGSTSCDPFGHFGVATTSFALPAGTASLYYPDVQQSFPDVDWQNIDRLYIPAGSYNVFAVGGGPICKLCTEYRRIWHWEGASWTAQVSGTDAGEYAGVWGAGFKDVYAVGPDVLHHGCP
jgi:hypothetical protein